MTTKYKNTFILSILTPILLVAVVFFMGAGHGTYAPGILLFPTGLVSFSITGQLETPFIILAIIQFPIYGLIVDKSNDKQKAALLIFAFHVGLALITFATTRNF
jgi:hypothetical protein